MAGQTYQMPEHPEYRTDIRKLRRQDPADAETVFNPLIQAMLENTHFVRLLAAEIIRQNTADHTAIQAEIQRQQQDIRAAVNLAEEGDERLRQKYDKQISVLDDETAQQFSDLLSQIRELGNDHTAIRQEMSKAISDAIDDIPTPDVSGQIGTHDGSASAHSTLFAQKADASALTAHTENQNNPHGVTAEQVGALPKTGGTVTGHVHLTSSSRIQYDSDGPFIWPGTRATIPTLMSSGAIAYLENRAVKGSRFQGIADPVNGADAANKDYVDSRTAADVGAVPVDADGNAEIAGNLRLKKGNYGTVLNFGDEDYVHLKELNDNILEVKAKSIKFVLTDTTDNGFTVNGEAVGKNKQEIVLMSSVPTSLSSKQIALVYV